MKADILIPMALRSDVENVVESARCYLNNKDWYVRLVRQENICPEDADKGGSTLEEFTESYRKFVDECGAPDVVIATDMPYMCFGAKKVAAQLGACWRVVSWLHSPVESLEAAGYGGYATLNMADLHFAANENIAHRIRQILPEAHVMEVQEKTSVEALADFECKLREIVMHLDSVLKVKECGSVYGEDKISVIIPCYNSEKYLAECIDSVLATSLPMSMMEFIFVNDGSTDGTAEIIKGYKARYPDNIILIELEENGGQGRARNIGMQYASGNYIGFVDSDDVVESGMFEALYEKAALYQCDITTCGYYMFLEDRTQRADVVAKESCFRMDSPVEKKRYMLDDGCRNFAWLHMFSGKFLDENDLRFPESTFMEDIYFCQLCMMHAKTCYVISKPLYGYRYNTNGVIHSNKLAKYYMDAFYMQERACQELESSGLLAGYEAEYALIYYVLSFYSNVARMLKNEFTIEYDRNNIETMRNAALSHFPDMADNVYINMDKAELNQKVLSILRDGV